MTKKEILKGLKDHCKNNRLKKRVLNIVLNDLASNNYEGSFEQKLEYLLNYYTSHRCSQGIVSELIFYSDTEKWFDNYRKEIIELLENYLFECEGCFEVVEDYENFKTYIKMNGIKVQVNFNCTGIEQKKFTSEQKNWLAWFSFEETAWELYNYFEGLKEA